MQSQFQGYQYTPWWSRCTYAMSPQRKTALSTVCSRWWVIGQTGVWPLVHSPLLIKYARETCGRTCGSHRGWEEHSGTVIRAGGCLLPRIQVSLLSTASLQSSLGSCIYFISAEQTISGRFWPYPHAQSHYGMGNVSYIFTARKASTKSSPFPHPLFQLCLKFPSEGIFLNVWLDLEEPCLHRTLVNCRQSVERKAQSIWADIIIRKG